MSVTCITELSSAIAAQRRVEELQAQILRAANFITLGEELGFIVNGVFDEAAVTAYAKGIDAVANATEHNIPGGE